MLFIRIVVADSLVVIHFLNTIGQSELSLL